jgi:hypothetical protein
MSKHGRTSEKKETHDTNNRKAIDFGSLMSRSCFDYRWFQQNAMLLSVSHFVGVVVVVIIGIMNCC